MTSSAWAPAACAELGWDASAVVEADGFIARLRGLRAPAPDGAAERVMAFPRCRSVHTFGMRAPIDVAFVGRGGALLAVYRDVPPGRIVSHREAWGVLERGRPEILRAASRKS